MASSGSNLWQAALAQVQNAGAGLALPPWLWNADLVEKSAAGSARPGPSRLQVRLPEAARPDELGAVVRSAHVRALERTIGRHVELEFTHRAGQAAPAPAADPGPAAPEPVAALMRRLTGVDITQCPVCHAGRLRLVAVFRPGHLPAPVLDTS